MSEEILKKIKKDYGIGITISGEEFLSVPKQVIPVSPAFDIALGGGIPEGSWWSISGPPKQGKSSLALSFAANAQRPEYGNRRINFFPIEGRLKEMNLRGIQGLQLDQDHFRIITSTKEKILSAQETLQIAEDLLRTTQNEVWIFDSFSCLVHEKEATDGIGASTRGGGAALLAQFCRHMSNVVPIKNHIVIGIHHLMANTSGYGASIIEKDGNAIRYQVDVKTQSKKIEYYPEKGKPLGQKVTWLIGCTALGMPPNQEVVSYLRYGIGIDRIAEIINIAKDVGLIETKAAGWTVLSFMQNHLDVLGTEKWDDEAIKICRRQGEEAIYQLLCENPKWIELLQQDIKKIYGI
jgi:RecA/RadA recombinase